MAVGPGPIGKYVQGTRGRRIGRSRYARRERGHPIAGDGQAELRRLAQEGDRVVVDDLANERFRVTPPPHLQDEVGHGRRHARSPVARGGDADPFRSVRLDHVYGALRGDLRLRVESDPGPVARVEYHLDRMLLGMVDHHPARRDHVVTAQRVDRDARALVLVLQVRRVDMDQLAVRERDLHVVAKRRHLVPSYAVHTDLADAEHGWPLQKLRYASEHLRCHSAVVTLLRVHADPREVTDTILGGPLRLEFGELPKIVLESIRGGAVPACPEGGLRYRDAAGQRHLHVVVRAARHHVRVQVDVLHYRASCAAESTRRSARGASRWSRPSAPGAGDTAAALPPASNAPDALLRSSASRGAVVGSLKIIWTASTRFGPAPASAATASRNAAMRYSSDVPPAVARSRRSRNAAMSSSFVRFSMKYSSTRSTNDIVGGSLLTTGLQASWRRPEAAQRMGSQGRSDRSGRPHATGQAKLGLPQRL